MNAFDLGQLLPLLAIAVTAGVAGGILAGLLGVGGGIVIVPALYLALSTAGMDPAITMQVAVGTSLPELAAVVAATYRGHSDVALGNVIGSNMFNLLAIVGVASFFGDMAVPPGLLRFDLWVMGAASLVLIPFVFLCWNITRIWGVIFTALYLGYLAVLLV